MTDMAPLVQGDTWSFQVGWFDPQSNGQPDYSHPVDLTGYEAHLQVRKSAGTEVLLDLTSNPSDGLTMNGVSGTIDIYASPDLTVDLPHGRLTWELEVFTPDNTYTLVTMPLLVQAQVTA